MSTGISVSVNGAEIAADLERVSRKAFKAVRSVIEQSAIDVRDEWKSNARESSGMHGKHYAKSINYKMVPSFSAMIADVEPREGMQQAGMSFEFGSRNQPPHLDGQQAISRYAPLIAHRISAALTF